MHKFREAEQRKSPSPKTSTPYVLLVEDAIISQLLIRKQLEHAKYNVVVATSGTDAIKQYQLYSRSIRVVLMDISLPGISGIATTNLLREVQTTPILIYALTGTLSNHLDNYINAGMDGYFYKGDFTINMFERAIQLSNRMKTFMTKQVIEDNFHPTLLMVDDMKITLKLAMNALKSSDHIVDCVSSGSQALNHYRKHQHSLKIILMDINLPDRSGCDVATEIRQHEHETAPTDPIIIFAYTTNINPQNLQDYQKAGMNGCIGKGQNLYLMLGDAIESYHTNPQTFINMT